GRSGVDQAGDNGAALCSPVRYRVLRPHARGGLGEVFVAEDTELHREVAFKEIQKPYAHDPHSRGRFLLEAEVNGRLEHPGVVPVYGLGSYRDGRPFYAMRFIRGESLKEAIDRFHAADVPGRDAGERGLALRQLLGQFVAVCNAVAYAHNRGILHRDLKPANILLGKFGETLVVDWGLAKPIGDPGEGRGTRGEGPSDKTSPLTPEPAALAEGAAPPGDLPSRSHADYRHAVLPSSDLPPSTRIGAAMGTPGFMSPEQAAGQWDSLGPASDIYSLGATLHVLLTGQVPGHGSGAGREGTGLSEKESKVRSALAAKPRPPNPVDLPRELQAICTKAMAPDPADRYATALDLAADIEHGLADERVSACPDPFPTRARRWLSRRRTLVGAVTAAVLVAMVGLVVGLVLLAGANERAQVARREAETQRDAGRL